MKLNFKNYLSKISGLCLGAISLLVAKTVLADTVNDYGAGTAAGQAKLTATPEKIPIWIGNLAGAALALAGALFMFLIIYGGILMMTSAGNQSQVDKGKKIIIWACIGVLVLGAAYAIATMVFTAIQ